MRDHRSLQAWQQARQLTADSIRLAARHRDPGCWLFFDQLRRAALSSQLNITEGYARGTPPQFRYHLRIAYASALEVEDILEVLTGEHLLPEEDVGPVVARCKRTQSLILGLFHSLGR